MGKTLEQLKAEAEAADRAYREAVSTGEEKLVAIAKEQDKAIRPEFKREPARDEFGNPIYLDQYGNPERGAGHKIEGLRARPVYKPPLRSVHNEPGAPPPDNDFKNAGGSWEQTEDLWLDLLDAIGTIEHDKLSQQDRETYVQQLVPSILDRMAAVVPRIDCAFNDGPMSKGAWMYLVGKYQSAFNPSKTLERSIGTMRSRTIPQFMTFALEGAKWLFRRCPTGIPRIPRVKIETGRAAMESSPSPEPIPIEDAPKRKPGRPPSKKVDEQNGPIEA